MKYIDADKLKAELRRQKRELELSIQSQGDYGQSCHIVAYENICNLITSLQQEQPECIYGRTPEEREKCCKFCSAICEARIEHEQLEVELEEEVKRWKNKHGVVGMDDLWLKFALHFYSLGLNARKEGEK